MPRFGLILFVVLISAGDGRAAERTADGPVSFRSDIQPILSKRCFACHGPNGEEGLVRFDRREAMIAEQVIVPGKPDESRLLKRVASTGPDERMPPKGEPLTAVQIGQLRKWIAEGAKFEGHWAFQPPVDTPPPAVRDAAWPRNAIDRFVLAKLEQAGLRPAPEADRPTLIRRLSFDLIGLPPTPDEIDVFVADRSPDAYERLVDRLLSSPHYGERSAQHWLDVVRFAETEGFEYDRLLPGAWRYRDYVIDAFNADLPYDRFVTEQLAGDELAANRESGDGRRLAIAAGMHRLGPVRRNAGNADVAMSRNEVLTTRTDVIGSAFLGLTIGCARCHDHKFDPVAQRDYYRLQAYLAASDEHDIVLVSEAERKAWQERTDSITGEMKKLTAKAKTAAGAEARELETRIEALNDKLPAPLPTITSVKNLDKPTPVHVLVRGDEGKKGALVEMGLPELFGKGDSQAVDGVAAGSIGPRTRLARRIVDSRNPLTMRVIVNRIWQQHFGIGLVATANDFGLHGEPPSHPELLDHLAIRFAAEGQSFKALHRLIVTSATYRQSAKSAMAEEAEAKDPDNRLLWHRRPQRLDAEALRDAMLAVSGRLNPKRGGESVVVPVDAELTALLYKPSQWTVTADHREHDRRSIYLLAKRNLRLPLLETFDQPSLQSSCARRESSTHAPQALELLNGGTSNDLAAALAERLAREADGPEQRVDRAFRLAAGRPPTETERRLSLEFVKQRSLKEFALALFNLNAFLYVD